VDDYAENVGKRLRVAVTALAAASGLALAGVATAATPEQIYADAADNGRLDRSYSAADLARYQHDATVAGYGNKIIKITVKPKVQPEIKPAAKQEVKPKKTMPHQVFRPTTKQAVARQTPAPQQVFAPPKSALPFTGSELATYVGLGISLVAGGFLLRMLARRRSSER
jgi:hypothetical protein